MQIRVTNQIVWDIAATLPKTLTSRYGYMVELAILDLSQGRVADHQSDTPAEIKAYNSARTAAEAYMAAHN